MIERIVLDMDGVLVDFIGGVSEWHNKPYPYYPHDPYTQPEATQWELEGVFDMSGPELWDSLGFEFWSNLAPLPHAKTVLGLLEERFGEENICLLTSPSIADGCIDGKMAWIKEHMPNYKRRFLIGPAKQFCASPTQALVDDYEGNVDAFEAAGGHAFLFPAPWNCKFGRRPVADLRAWLINLDVLSA